MSPTIVRLGTRSVFGRRRGILLFLLPLVLIGLAGLIRGLVGAGRPDRRRRAAEPRPDRGRAAGRPARRPPGVLAPEIDDGSISYLLAKPISRHTIVLSKLLVAVACVVVFAVVPMFVAGLILLLRRTRPRARLRGRLAGRRRRVLRAVRAAVRADPPRRGDRPPLPAGLGGPARRPARRRPLAQRHPLGRARSPRRSPTSTSSTSSARCTPSWRRWSSWCSAPGSPGGGCAPSTSPATSPGHASSRLNPRRCSFTRVRTAGGQAGDIDGHQRGWCVRCSSEVTARGPASRPGAGSSAARWRPGRRRAGRSGRRGRRAAPRRPTRPGRLARSRGRPGWPASRRRLR